MAHSLIMMLLSVQSLNRSCTPTVVPTGKIESSPHRYNQCKDSETLRFILRVQCVILIKRTIVDSSKLQNLAFLLDCIVHILNFNLRLRSYAYPSHLPVRCAHSLFNYPNIIQHLNLLFLSLRTPSLAADQPQQPKLMKTSNRKQTLKRLSTFHPYLITKSEIDIDPTPTIQDPPPLNFNLEIITTVEDPKTQICPM